MYIPAAEASTQRKVVVLTSLGIRLNLKNNQCRKSLAV
jgi:hypothetical protein